MHPRAEEFAAAAREQYGFDPEISEFPEGTRTAADAAAAIGCEVGAIASSLVFRLSVDGVDPVAGRAGSIDPDRPYVVAITSGANRVDEGRLAAHLGADDASMADAEEVRDVTGWTIGGVPPFCHETAVPVVIDETLDDYDRVWAAAGTPEAVFQIAPARVRELSGATAVALA
jgi:prolyl-tRNA editing enzyme YbaK/EbsC (Cys-tRNA(Pro) deacylase)